jgi:hypothetical protein
MAELLPFPSDGRTRDGVAIARGVARLFQNLGFSALVEFPLGIGRRVDVAGLRRDGSVAVAEVKSCLADFRADKKWHEYLDFCDAFYFAVPEGFPVEVLPPDTGLIIADQFGGSVVRPGPRPKLSAARRKALTLRFARCAAYRLSHAHDPSLPAVQDLDG